MQCIRPCRRGGIGRRSGLKIRFRIRSTGSSPVGGTIFKRHNGDCAHLTLAKSIPVYWDAFLLALLIVWLFSINLLAPLYHTSSPSGSLLADAWIFS